MECFIVLTSILSGFVLNPLEVSIVQFVNELLSYVNYAIADFDEPLFGLYYLIFSLTYNKKIAISVKSVHSKKTRCRLIYVIVR